MRHALFACGVSLLFSYAYQPTDALAQGQFQGRVVTEWAVDRSGADRNMVLVEDFSFVYNNRTWTVPVGAVVNGASIPEILWLPVGSPFVGDYRRASVLHDYYYKVRTEPAPETHRMFTAAAIEDGWGTIDAYAAYAALMWWCPEWGHQCGGRSITQVILNRMRTWVVQRLEELASRLSFEEIDRYVEEMQQG